MLTSIICKAPGQVGPQLAAVSYLGSRIAYAGLEQIKPDYAIAECNWQVPKGVPDGAVPAALLLPGAAAATKLQPKAL